ncbi:hypothetical protein HMPREF9374_2768 [Desmospora sp. 8437]|nr:hypothetical protein HMPREF9374_2768 [Desmospora sp. 8437]
MRIAVGILLSLIVPGLGQFVNGQRIKGSVLLLLDLLFIIAKNGLSIAPLLILYVVALADTIIFGLRVQRGELSAPSGRNWVIEVILVTVVAGGLTMGVDELTKSYFANRLNFGGDSVDVKEKQKITAEAETYLKKKYGMDFTVNQVKYIWQTGKYTMRGRAQNEKTDFLVERDENGDFIDSYFFHLMSRDARKELEPQIKGDFPDVLNWEVTVWVEEQVEEEMAEETPSLMMLRGKTKDYKEKIRINVVKKVGESSVGEEARRLSSLFDYLNGNKIQASVQVNYYDPSIKQKGIQKIDFQKQLRYDQYLTASLEVNDVSAFQSAEAIEDAIEVYE